MAENLDVNDGGPGIEIYRGTTYYTWDAAVRVCGKLDQWHLPTLKEWLAAGFTDGGDNWGFYDPKDGLVPLSLRDFTRDFFGVDHGPYISKGLSVYWTATPVGREKAWDATFNRYGDFDVFKSDKDKLLPVRCVHT